MSETISGRLRDSETQVKEFYSSTLPQIPSLSGDMALMCKPLNDTSLFEMDQIIATIDDLALHLADIKLDLMKERLLIARRGLIMIHETAHWDNSSTIVNQLHHDIAHGKWGSREWQKPNILPMCALCKVDTVG
ncbi:hypothetical protein HWV62_10561 [Athelia sp. TMB]|nr:hypothetical protein HWV62_10561 [Athelia sp. TMB]